ncbi:uncharacterized protein [Palaemon carinicauda]|uniref:uncharacterized protein isoform X2 n=1 Tax=Palaemon carinicauda TaxID=392227 RepID=UPI0035B656B8
MKIDDMTTQCARVFVTLLLTATMIYTITLNGLAGPGIGPFKQSTGNVSDLFFTCITPAGFTFAIWSVIYICLVLILIYAITLLFREVEDDRAWKAGGAISIPFMLMLVVNFNLNVGWLFAWDAVNATGSAILLLLIALTNTIAIAFMEHSFAQAASSLYTISKLDFWCGILSINGMGFYVAWTILASLVNLTILFQYEIELEGNGVCLGVLIFLLVALLIWFVLENSLLKMFSNPLITHYLVVIWAMTGIYSEQKELASGEVVALLITNLTVASVMLLARIGFLIYRNRINKLYCDPSIQDDNVQQMKF